MLAAEFQRLTLSVHKDCMCAEKTSVTQLATEILWFRGFHGHDISICCLCAAARMWKRDSTLKGIYGNRILELYHRRSSEAYMKRR